LTSAKHLAVVKTLAARAVGVVGVELCIAQVVTDARVVPLTVDRERNAEKEKRKSGKELKKTRTREENDTGR